MIANVTYLVLDLSSLTCSVDNIYLMEKTFKRSFKKIKNVIFAIYSFKLQVGRPNARIY